jgi:hypothetical protein
VGAFCEALEAVNFLSTEHVSTFEEISFITELVVCVFHASVHSRAYFRIVQYVCFFVFLFSACTWSVPSVFLFIVSSLHKSYHMYRLSCCMNANRQRVSYFSVIRLCFNYRYIKI